MKIEMQVCKENEDGSADVVFEMDEEAKRWIMTIGIEAMLMKAIESAEITPIQPPKVTPEVTPEEEEAWKRLEEEQRIDAYAEAYHEASYKAQEFIDGATPAELGIFTLRKAFETGFINGVIFVKNRGDM
jgi:hypothetical protein